MEQTRTASHNAIRFTETETDNKIANDYNGIFSFILYKFGMR